MPSREVQPTVFDMVGYQELVGYLEENGYVDVPSRYVAEGE